jgi:hypothetical protein
MNMAAALADFFSVIDKQACQLHKTKTKNIKREKWMHSKTLIEDKHFYNQC